MSGILSRASYSVVPDQDMIAASVGGLRFTSWYQDGFKLAQDIRVACKRAMVFDQTCAQQWRAIAGLEDLEELPALHHTYRRSKKRPTLMNWETAIEGPIVVIIIFDQARNRLEMKLHFSDALRLHVAIRHASRAAKSWAGDFSKVKRTVGVLTDAEMNDRIGA